MGIATTWIGLLPGPAQDFARNILGGQDERGRSGRGALTAFLIRVAAAAIAFASQVILARWMGTFEFGLFTTAWVWITVIGSLAQLGIATSVIRFLPEYRETGRDDLARGFLASGRAICVLSGAVAMGFGWLAIAMGLVHDSLVLPLGLVLAALPAYALTDFQDGIGRSQGWIDLALLPPYVIRPVLLFAFIAIVELQGREQSAVSAALAAVAATWVTVAIQYFLQRSRMPANWTAGSRASDLRGWIAMSLPLLLLDGFSLLLFNLDILLLDLFVGSDQVGIYFAAIRTISLVGFIQFSIAAIAMPRFAEMRASGRHHEITPVLRELQHWTFWPSLLGVAGLLLCGYPLLWLFGPDFTTAYPVMFALAVGLLLRAWAGPAQCLLVVGGRQKAAAAVLMLAVIVNVVLNVLLIPQLGILGAAIATAAAFSFEAAINLILCNRFFPGTAHGPHAPAAG